MAEKKVSLLCPACGKDQFESLDVELKDLRAADNTACIRCASCDAVYTKREVIDGNLDRVALAAGELVEETLLDGKEVESIHKAYLRSLLRHLEKMRKSLWDMDYETTERLLSELIEDTKADISGEIRVLNKWKNMPLS